MVVCFVRLGKDNLVKCDRRKMMCGYVNLYCFYFIAVRPIPVRSLYCYIFLPFFIIAFLFSKFLTLTLLFVNQIHRCSGSLVW